MRTPLSDAAINDVSRLILVSSCLALITQYVMILWYEGTTPSLPEQDRETTPRR